MENIRLKESEGINSARLTEIDYHKKMNRRFAAVGAILFAFFAIYHLRRDNYLQAILFSILFINAAVSLFIGPRITHMDNLVRLKRIAGSIAFGLLAVSLLAGMMSSDIYTFLPWLFIYPVAATLFFGKRIAVCSALAFTLVAVPLFIFVDLPPWSTANVTLFKFNAVLSFIALVTFSLIAEKNRIRVQKELIDSQNEYKDAERRQREANVELQNEIELRIQSQKLLQQSELRYRALFEESAVPLFEEDWSELKNHFDTLPQEASKDLGTYFNSHPQTLTGCIAMMRVTAVNRATLTMCEADSPETLLGNIPRILPPPSGDTYLRDRMIALHENGSYHAGIEAQTLTGKPLHLLVSCTIPAGFHASWSKVFTSVYDATERVALEEERKRVDQHLQQTRSMQAVATLAGGIAHQFNNALSSIYGNLDLIEINNQNPSKVLRYIEPLRSSADRMGVLTDQLLAYAQGGKYQPMNFSVNDLLQKVIELNRIDISASVKVTIKLEPDICTTHGDTTQIEMVIEAILSNALESMDTERRLNITTRNIQIQHTPAVSAPKLPAGTYATIDIRDSGVGMDDQARERIFEPFFTTKFFGRGLGMAAAYGIVRNHAGVITVDSAPDQGTRVTVYLPGI